MAKKDHAEEIIQYREMDTDITRSVVMRNDLILGTGHSKGKEVSGLSLTAKKILKLVIMQCKKDDEGLYAYEVMIPKLAQVLDVNRSNLYRDIEQICATLQSEIVLFKDLDTGAIQTFNYVDTCKYENGKLTVKLDNNMTPYCLALRNRFTMYPFGDIKKLTSSYAIDIYELITLEVNKLRSFSKSKENKRTIYLSLETIRKKTGTNNRYKRAPDLIKRIINPSIKNIVEGTQYKAIEINPKKESGKIVGIYLTVTLDEKAKEITEKVEYFHTPELNDALRRFVEHKEDLDKKKMSDASISVLVEEIKKQHRLSGGKVDEKKAVETINYAIGRGWKWIFPLPEIEKRNKYVGRDPEKINKDLDEMEQLLLWEVNREHKSEEKEGE